MTANPDEEMNDFNSQEFDNELLEDEPEVGDLEAVDDEAADDEAADDEAADDEAADDEAADEEEEGDYDEDEGADGNSDDDSDEDGGPEMPLAASTPVNTRAPPAPQRKRPRTSQEAMDRARKSAKKMKSEIAASASPDLDKIPLLGAVGRHSAPLKQGKVVAGPWTICTGRDSYINYQDQKVEYDAIFSIKTYSSGSKYSQTVPLKEFKEWAQAVALLYEQIFDERLSSTLPRKPKVKKSLPVKPKAVKAAKPVAVKAARAIAVA